MMPSMPADLISVSAAARLAQVHPDTIREWADKGLVGFERTLGGHRRIDRDSLLAALGRTPSSEVAS